MPLVTLTAGRSMKVRRHMLAALSERLVAAEVDPEPAMVAFQENWAVAGTRLLHA